MCFGQGKLSLSMKDVPICEVNEIKDLGLLIANRSCLDSHIKYQLHKCSQVLALMKMSVSSGLSCWRKMQLYQSPILSILLYCREVWCPSVTCLKKLEISEKFLPLVISICFLPRVPRDLKHPAPVLYSD